MEEQRRRREAKDCSLCACPARQLPWLEAGSGGIQTGHFWPDGRKRNVASFIRCKSELAHVTCSSLQVWHFLVIPCIAVPSTLADSMVVPWCWCPGFLVTVMAIISIIPSIFCILSLASSKVEKYSGLTSKLYRRRCSSSSDVGRLPIARSSNIRNSHFEQDSNHHA